jgi:hypothetical protein
MHGTFHRYTAQQASASGIDCEPHALTAKTDAAWGPCWQHFIIFCPFLPLTLLVVGTANMVLLQFLPPANHLAQPAAASAFHSCLFYLQHAGPSGIGQICWRSMLACTSKPSDSTQHWERCANDSPLWGAAPQWRLAPLHLVP